MPLGISIAISENGTRAFTRQHAILHRRKGVLSCLSMGLESTSAPQDYWVSSWIILTGSKIVVQLPAMLLIHSDVSCMEVTELSTLQYERVSADVSARVRRGSRYKHTERHRNMPAKCSDSRSGSYPGRLFTLAEAPSSRVPRGRLLLPGVAVPDACARHCK